MRPNWITCLITAGLLLAVAVYASAQDVEHGRISYVDNDGLIRGLEDEEWSVAQQNSLVMPGDSIWADEQGVLEVEVSGGTFVRLADDSRMEVVAMPPATHVRASTGSFYIHRLRHSEGDVVFETPVGSIMIENNSQVRVDVLEEGSTTVTTRWGNAIIRTADGLSVRVPSDHQVFIDPGYAPSSPTRYDRNVEDTFDTWNRERSRRIAKSSSSTKIARAGTYAAPIGTYDLEDYGEWVEVDNSSYWRPTVVDYVPYRSGRWSYVPNHGHVWVGYQPFTYVTSHHGYWKHHHRHGWIWSYHQTYSPAYVASVYHNDTFIWAPLSRHGDAVHISGSYFTAGGFHFSLGYSSYSHSRYVLHGHHNHHVYSMNHHASYHHNKHYNAHHWNHYDTHSRHYKNRPHRIKHHSGERHYRPNHKMRGPSEVQLAGGRTYNARAGQLDARSSKYEFKPVLMDTNRKSHRTPTNGNERKASVRSVRFNDDPVQKIARRDESMRRTRPVTPQSVATRSSTERKNSDVSTRGSVPNRGGEGRRVTTTPNQRSTATNPSTPSTTRPGTTTRSGDSTTRPTTPTRPNTSTTRPKTPTRSGDSATRPTTPTRPKASTTRPSTRSRSGESTTRPTTPTRPNTSTTRPNTPSRPQGTTQRREAPTRQTYTPRTTTQTQPRSSTTRPQATTPRKTAPSQRTYTPRTTTQTRPQTSNPRTTTPSRPQVNTPRRTAPQPRTTAPRQSAPQQRTTAPRQTQRPQTSAPRQSTPQPRVSAPRPVQQQRSSAPRQSAPQPRASAPSRSSSSSRSYSAPPSRSSSSSSSRAPSSSSSSRSSGSRSSSRSR